MFLRRHLSLHNLGTHVRQEGPHATGPSERQLLVTIGLPKQFHFTYSCLPLYGKLIQSLSIYARTNRYKNSFILFGLNHFQ